MRHGILNSPAMLEILENHRVEYDFEPGDALLFNKMVVHRGVVLEEGPLAKRAAYVMRFVEARCFAGPAKTLAGNFRYRDFLQRTLLDPVATAFERIVRKRNPTTRFAREKPREGHGQPGFVGPGDSAHKAAA